MVEETCVPKKSVAVGNLVLVYNFFCAATLFRKKNLKIIWAAELLFSFEDKISSRGGSCLKRKKKSLLSHPPSFRVGKL